MKPRVLHITPAFNYTCGRSYYLYITLKYLNSFNCFNYLLSKEDIANQRIEELKIPFSIDKKIGGNNPLYFPGLLKRIHSIVDKYNINILHSYSRSTELICLLYRKYINKNLITLNTIMSLVNSRYFLEYKSDKLISISKSVKNQLIHKFKVSENKINLIYNYAEPVTSNYISEITNEQSFNILAVGRYHREKNFETLLDAIKYLNNPNIKVNLIGSGNLKESYQRYIASNNLNVKLIPPQNDLSKYFLESQICVLPSIVDPLPTFLIQSGFYKKPFIGSNVDGIAESITDGYNGLLFKKEDPTELAEKINTFYKDPILMNKCASNLFEHVCNKHTPEVNVKNIYNLYQTLLSNKIP